MIKVNQGLRRNFWLTIALRIFGIVVGLIVFVLTYINPFKSKRKMLNYLTAIDVLIFGVIQIGFGAVEINTTDPTYR